MDAINFNELQNKIYRKCLDRSDINKVDKIINAVKSNEINKENYWDVIKKFTKNVTSDHSIHRWQCFSECIAEQLFN